GRGRAGAAGAGRQLRRTRGAGQARRELHAAGSGRRAAARRKGAVIAELGEVALLLALAVALVQGSVPLAGAARGRADWMALARRAAEVQCVLVAVAFGCLVTAFVRNDFSVAYVAGHSHSALPLVYRVSAAWGG